MPTFLRRAANAAIGRLLPFTPTRFALYYLGWKHHGRIPNLDRPRTFNEKIAHRKLFDRDPRLPRFADKILVKEHVAQVLGPEWIVPTVWQGRELPPRQERNWPIPYVLKANHGSGWNIFVNSPESQRWDEIERATALWLKQDYGRRKREWAYTKIEPRLLVEPHLGDPAGFPLDLEVWVFSGKAFQIEVNLGKQGEHEQYFFDLDWNRKPFVYSRPGPRDYVPRPASLERIVAAGERLGDSFPFVRVDFYEVGGRPYFGEMTFYPNGGLMPFKPETVDAELGRLWR